MDNEDIVESENNETGETGEEEEEEVEYTEPEVKAGAFGIYPFNPAIHIKTADPTPEQKEKVEELRALLQDFAPYHNHLGWADDTQLLRFLIARNFKMKDSFELIKSALKWRDLRRPAEIENGPEWPANMSRESETGKIRSPGHDKWGRSVLILDNTVENTRSIDDQMTFLAWNLEYAIKRMPPTVDKYLVFMHLTDFSFFNTPPLASTKETIHMVCSCFPERLGHCIVYQPPTVFRVFFSTVKGFLDPKTASKMIFLSGDMSDGSANDIRMRELIGDNWKVLTGAEQPKKAKGYSPGYSHETHWPQVMQFLEERKAKAAAAAAAAEGEGETTATASPSSSEPTTPTPESDAAEAVVA